MKNEGMEILNALIKEHGKEKAVAMASRFFEGVKTGPLKGGEVTRYRQGHRSRYRAAREPPEGNRQSRQQNRTAEQASQEPPAPDGQAPKQRRETGENGYTPCKPF